MVSISDEVKETADLESIREWFQYNDYVRKKYLKLLETMPEQQLTKDRGASFPTLLDISAHIFFAYRLWLDALYNGVPLDENDTYGRRCQSIQELRADADKMSPYILDFVNRLHPEDLGRWIDRPRGGRALQIQREEHALAFDRRGAATQRRAQRLALAGRH